MFDRSLSLNRALRSKIFRSKIQWALGVVAVATLAAGTAWGQAAGGAAPASGQAAAGAQPQWKDQGEYDLAMQAMKATDPQKKIDLLKQWEAKYPTSAFKDKRVLMQAQAEDQMALAAYGKTDPGVLDTGQKAAQILLDNLDTYFAPDVKPATVTDQQWNDAKKTMQIQGWSVLAYAAMMKKDDATAETDFKKLLAIDPNNAQASYWLGSVIIRQHKQERYPEALYSIARAISITGPTALTPEAKAAAQKYLKSAYEGYHGDSSGLDQLMQQVSASALPPDGFHIDSVVDVQNKQFANAADFKKANPDIALWREIKTTLTGDGGDAYFQQVKGSEIPPEKDTDGNVIPKGMFRAKVVSVSGKDLVANVDNAAGDVTLRFEHPLNEKEIQAGAAFQFKGVVDSYTKAPSYMLTLTIDDPKTEIDGLPAKAFSAAPATHHPARKTTHKKG